MEAIVQDKKQLYLIGASHLGRELESLLESIPIDKRDFQIKGFLHNYDGKSPLDGYPTDYKILGEWDTFALTKKDHCLIAVADVAWREKIFNLLIHKTNIFSFIHPSAMIVKYVKIGLGCVISAHCHVSTNVQIGNNVFLNGGSQIGHDVTIGNFSSIMSQVEIGGGCIIGKKVFIGSNVTILPNITVEDDCVIGAGSVVIKKVKKGTTVFGNPAKVI